MARECTGDSPHDLIDQKIELCQGECSKLFRKVKQVENELENLRSKYKKSCDELKKLKEDKLLMDSKEIVNETNNTLQSDWIDKEFPWMETVNRLLKENFKFSEFRPKQLAAINATLSKRDVILVMPTAGGKSLVYQLPSLVNKGITLVISPLISLMVDQIMASERFGIKAATVYSGSTKETTKEVYEEMNKKNCNLRLLYVTPEWIAKSKRFMLHLKKAYELGILSRIAIDEVHCCSTWGHDFRPDYKFLGLLRPMFPNTPFLGVTATASMSVLSDIQSILNLNDSMIITAPFNRPNLFFEVIGKSTKSQEVAEVCEGILKKTFKGQSGIIYTTTVNDSINLAKELRTMGIKAAPYHAMLEAEQKEDIHKKWLDNHYQVVVATIAFGMGIDKPDVRFIIHHAMPKSMENYYQECGRAGRDGKKANCILLFSLGDFCRVLGLATSTMEETKCYSILEYCINSDRCRRDLLAVRFGELWDQNQCEKMCDHCLNPKKEVLYYDLASICKHLHEIIDKANSNGDKLTLIKLLDGWYHTGGKNLRITTIPKPKFSRTDAEILVAHLLIEKYLRIDKGYTTYTTICYIQKGKGVGNHSIKFSTIQRFHGLTKWFENNGNGNQIEDDASEEPPPKKKKN